MTAIKVTLALVLIACTLVASQADTVDNNEESELSVDHITSEGIIETNNRVKRQFGILGALLGGGGGYGYNHGGYNHGGYNQYYGKFFRN